MHPDEDNIFKNIWGDGEIGSYYKDGEKELSQVTNEIQRAIDKMIVQSPVAEPTRSTINRATLADSQYSRSIILYDKLFDLLGRMTGVMESYFDPSVVPEELKQISSELHELRKEFNRSL